MTVTAKNILCFKLTKIFLSALGKKVRKVPWTIYYKLQNAYVIFQEGVDNFELEHKTC